MSGIETSRPDEFKRTSAASRLLAAAEIWPGHLETAPLNRNPEPQVGKPLPAALTSALEIRLEAQPNVLRKETSAKTASWPPRKLSLALQGGGTFAAFTWGVLERLLEEPGIEFDTISGASAGAINALLLASGLAEGGREEARERLSRFWTHLTHEASFRSLMLIGGFSPAGSSVAFGPALRAGQFDPFDLDPLRQQLCRFVDFAALRDPRCPRLLLAATRIRDGSQQVFGNDRLSVDVALASTCPPLLHGAVEIDGDPYWDGGYGANPPLVGLLQQSTATDVLVIQVTPARDSYVPITMAAIDRRLDQIAANAVLNAELAAVEWARDAVFPGLRMFRIAAEDEVEGLAQRSCTDLGLGFIGLLHRSGRNTADRWLGTGTVVGPQRQQMRATTDTPALRTAPAELV